MAEKKEAKTKAPKKPSRSQSFHSGITAIYNIASDRAGVAVRHLLESHGDAILEAFEASIMKVVEDLVRSRIADLRKQVEEAEGSLSRDKVDTNPPLHNKVEGSGGQGMEATTVAPFDHT